MTSKSRGSSVGIEPGYRLEDQSSSTVKHKNFYYFKLFGQVMEPTKSPVQWVPAQTQTQTHGNCQCFWIALMTNQSIAPMLDIKLLKPEEGLR
jgi:hypothetical protein